MIQNLWDTSKAVQRGTILPQETRKISNKQPNHTPKATRERRKPKVNRRKETIKIRAEINERKEESCFRTSFAVQWLRLRASNAGAWVRSLVGELRSHMPRGAAKNNNKSLLY